VAPASSTPPSTPAPVAQPGANQFRVDPGDTLGGIAAQFGVSLQGLINANPGIDPNKIYPGQILNFAPKPKPAPARVPYCFVEAGDTLGGIAIQFGVSMARILAVNPGINPDRIYPGQRINL
jgi:LysM repeat protein